MSKLGDKLVGAIKNKGKNLEGEMSFFEHLEALRWHLVRSALAILVLAIFAFAFYHELFDGIVMAPGNNHFYTYRKMCEFGEWLHSLIPWISAESLCVKDFQVKLISTELAGQFNLQLNSAIVIGITIGIPYILWEIWRFIRPALHQKERKAASGFVFYSSLLFALGVTFGYFIVTPLAVKFLATYSVSDSITNMFSIDSYISTVTMLTLASGIAFQLPIIVYILAYIGILTPKFMRKTRRYAVVIILILAAFITPTPDALSMCVVALPLLLLYELSILIAALVEKRKAKKEKEEGLINT
jgi:sec-independent protein translocase protein TatC